MSLIPSWVWCIITAVVISLAGYGLHSLDIDRLETKNADAVTAQKTSDDNSCQKQQQESKEIDNGLQKQDSLSVGGYNAALQLLGNSKIVPPAITAGGASISIKAARDQGLYCTDLAGFRRLLYRLNVAGLQTNQLVAANKLLVDERINLTNQDQ